MKNDRDNSANIAPGSIIKRDLDGLPGTAMFHVGIYIGKGKVIHFNGEWGSGAKAHIEKTTLSAFSKGRPVRVHSAPKNPTHGKAVVRKANRAIANPKGWDGKYNFASNNCEDFTQHCFEVEYREAKNGEKSKGSAPWSQRAKAVVVATGSAIFLVVTALAAGRSKGPPSPPPRA